MSKFPHLYQLRTSLSFLTVAWHWKHMLTVSWVQLFITSRTLAVYEITWHRRLQLLWSMHVWHQDWIIVMPCSMVYQIWYCTKVPKNQNAAARVVIGTNKFEHITPVLNNLHWLQVKFWTNFKILLLTFKAYHGLAASYLCDLIDKNLSTYSLRNYDDFLLVEPRTKLKTYSNRAFSKGAPFLWNPLPIDICRSPNVASFKQRDLKHIFLNWLFAPVN